MRVSVLLVVPAQDSLRESALAAAEKRASRSELFVAGLPPEFELDRNYPAVPLGSRDAEPRAVTDWTQDPTHPANSELFVVRGFIDVPSLDQVPSEIGGHPVFSDPSIAAFPVAGCPPQGPIGTSADVASKLGVDQLKNGGLTGRQVAIAIMDTGISIPYLTAKLGHAPNFAAQFSWTPPGSTTPPGTYSGVNSHATMCAYDALIAAPDATLLDYPILRASGLSATLSNALQALTALKSTLQGLGPYSAVVVNNSWGVYNPLQDLPPGNPGRYIDNPKHPFNVLVVQDQSLYDILFAAGNCGTACPDQRCGGPTPTVGAIRGANSLQSVITVAGCTVNDEWVGYSSVGPSIAGMFQEKPDITAYTHFLGSEAFGTGSADSGTSTSCPVVAGVVAAVRTKFGLSSLQPKWILAALQGNGRQPNGVAAGWYPNYGWGIVAPMLVAIWCAYFSASQNTVQQAINLRGIGMSADFIAKWFFSEHSVSIDQAAAALRAAGFSASEIAAAINDAYGSQAAAT